MVRVGMTLAGIFAACTSLSSCMSGPTYGTDKTAMEQLADDLGSAASISGNKKPEGKYSPRPDLVLPPKGAQAELVQPQTSLASKDNPEWVESPEDTRKRLVAEADANSNNPNYRSPLLAGYGTNGTMTETQKWQAFRDARKIQKGAYLDQRRVLSDPPDSYRMVDESKLTDLGEPEAKKEKRRQKEAQISNSGKNWWQPFQ